MARNEVKVSITGDASQLIAATAAGDAAMGGFAGKLGGWAGKLGAIAAVGGAAIAAGIGVAAVGLFKIGESFDASYDTIRVGTGATGDALAGLQDDFREVVKNVPTDFASASTAIADLNTRLGLSGPELQGVAGQVLELTRLTGGDLQTTIAGTTRVMGDWSVATADMPGALDALYRASQATGISVESLSEGLVKYGAPLRQMGFDFDTSAALLGKFEKEGVNAELVMGSLRVALGRMAKNGEPAVETFKRVTGEIKNAGSTSEANAKALELFGARAGPDMAAAIREGRFELGDLLGVVADGGETIMGAAADTEDFAEKFTKLKNRVLVGLEPLAMGVFDALGNGMDALAPIAEEVAGGLTAFFAAFKDGSDDVTSSGIAGWFEEMGVRARNAFDAISVAVGQAADWIRRNWDTISTVVSTAAKIWLLYAKAVIGGAVVALKVVGTVVSWLADNVVRPFIAWLQTDGVEIWNRLSVAAVAFAGWIQTNVWPVIQDLGALFAVVWGKVSTVVAAAVNYVRTIITAAMPVISAVWEGAWNLIAAVIPPLWDGIRAVVETVLGVIQGVIRFVTAVISGDWAGAWNAIRQVLSTVWNGLLAIVRASITFMGNLIRGAMAFVAGVWSGAWSAISNVLGGVWNGILGKVSGAMAWMGGVVSGGISWVAGLFSGMGDRIGSVLGNLASAITAPFRSAFDGIRTAWNATVGGKGFSIPDWVPGLGGKSFTIPTLYTGGRILGEGYAMVGELGPELVKLPTGSTVYPNGYGPAPTGPAAGGAVHVHFHGPVSRDAEQWVVDMLARANRSGRAKVPGVVG